MNINNKTVLITGGGSGIGLEIAKQLTAKGNHVIITGRSEGRLKQAAAALENISTFTADVTEEADVDNLVEYLTQNHPTLDVVINNAGQASFNKLGAEGANSFEKGGEEILTNYLAVVRLNEKLLPLLKQQAEGAIVNVTSIVAYVPNVGIATYAASKAALHSYTQSLRYVLAKDTAIKVFELFPPLVDTDFSKEIGGENGIKPSVVADEFIAAFEKNEYEIHVGFTADLYKMFLSSPQEALKALNVARGNE
jgi:uncharacterized oxidoreductase